MPTFAALYIALAIIVEEPPLADRDRFPHRQAAAEAIRFNREFRQQVECWRQWDLARRNEWNEVAEETDYLFQCWDWLHAAQEGEGRDEVYWRQSLSTLRGYLGAENYRLGRMPPPVPMHRFREIR